MKEDDSNFIPIFLLVLAFLYVALLCVSVYEEYFVPKKCENEVIKNSKDYSEFDKCKEIDNKYYCYNK